jgi:hypothetical protein
MTKTLFRWRVFLVTGTLLAGVSLFTRCMDKQETKRPPITHFNGEQYAGDEACRSCHQAIYDSFISTAHWLTSRIAEPKYIRGSLASGENEFVFDAHRKVVMELREDGVFQTAYTDGKAGESERFDIVMGSGRKGQTFIYWKGREMYQLPITYFASVHAWANSPGYSPDKIFFGRYIEGRCMECHTTSFKRLSSTEYDSAQILYGVSCERCHGPGEKHVAFQTAHPGEKQGRWVINPAGLSRERRLDACAVCHSGVMRSRKPAGSFLPGDTLANYFILNSSHIDSSHLDVHANQYGLLTASKCFRISGVMDCSTCHNTHVRESGNLAVYGQKCMGCHTPGGQHFCTIKPPAGLSMKDNCVNCHMPVRESKNLTMLAAGRKVVSPEQVRTHLIAVYMDAARRVCAMDSRAPAPKSGP